MSLRLLQLILLAVCTLACGRHPDASADAPRSVRVSIPEAREQAEGYALSGTVVPQRVGQFISFTVPGRLVSVGPREGEAVRRGEVLARLETVSLSAGLDAAQAQTRAARAALERAEDERARMERVFRQGAMAENDYLKFRLAERAYREQLAQARANEVVAAKALSDAALVAPVAGIVTRRLVEPGATVGAGQPAFELAQVDPVEIQVGVPENLIASVQVGQAATVTLPAVPGATFEGKVRVLNAAADPGSRTYMARVAVENPRNLLRLGMVAEARIQGTRRERMLLVPLDAVVSDPRGVTQVFELRDGRAMARRVTLGALEGQLVEVRAGIEEGARIVTAGQHRLRDGDRAEVEAVVADGSQP